jgi:hypothetical protein
LKATAAAAADWPLSSVQQQVTSIALAAALQSALQSVVFAPSDILSLFLCLLTFLFAR